jgi:hypothetical protein
MIRRDTTVAGALSALLVLGVCGAASAQGAQPDPGSAGQEQPHGNKGAGQEQFERDKLTLKEHVQEQIDAADANIDALKKMTANEKGPRKKQHSDMEKQLSDSRDTLKKDLHQIDHSTMNDWTNLRATVQRNMMATSTQLQRVAAVTKLPIPQTGAASQQPQNP